MEFKEIQDILKLVNKTNLTEVEIEKKDFKIKIRKKLPESSVIYTTPQTPALAQTQAMPASSASTPPPQAQPNVTTAAAAPAAEKSEVEDSNLYTFKSPMIGTFYRASTPESDPYIKVGDHIQKGQVICIIEAMKLFNEIESEVEGKLVKILIDNAQPVEYDQPLFLIDPNG